MKYLSRLVIVLLLLSSFQILANDDFSRNLQELNTNGYTVVTEVFTHQEVKQLAAQYYKTKERALKIVADNPAQPRRFSENDTENKSVFWKTDKELIMQAGKGRYDFYQGFSDGVFGTDLVLKNPKLEELMREIMLDEFASYSGVILSSSGSNDQYWHRDTNNLTNVGTDGSKLITMDDFYFTILIPVTVPFTIENGTTEFMQGSHRLPAAEFSTCKLQQVFVPIGSALVFNGKMNHRGKANNSKADRPALYLVYHKKWYNDQYRSGVN